MKTVGRIAIMLFMTLGYIYGLEIMWGNHAPFEANWHFWIVVIETLAWTAFAIMGISQAAMDKVIFNNER